MGTPPKWIIRWGIVVIFLVVMVLLAGSYYYKYPDIINARVTIVSENPPISVVARSDGLPKGDSGGPPGNLRDLDRYERGVAGPED